MRERLETLSLAMKIVKGSVFGRKGGEPMKRKMKNRIFDPERYEMIFCSGCNGSGRSFDDATGTSVCRVCGGFGLIMKQEKNNPYNFPVPIRRYVKFDVEGRSG
jgi:hypothetical protein